MKDFLINPNHADHIFVAGQALSGSNYFIAPHKSTKTLLAEVASNVFEFRHLKAVRDKAYMYACAAIDNQGREGESASVTVK